MGADFSYQDLTSCSSHPGGSRVSFAYTPSNLSGSEPSLKNQPDRVKSAPMTGRPALSSRLRTSTHRPNNATEAASLSSSFPAVGSNDARDSAAIYNGSGRSWYSRDTGTTDKATAAAAAAAAANAGASSSELSESDNEAGLNRSSADCSKPGFQHGNEMSAARDSFSANHSSDRLNVTALPEVTPAACNCACHGSGDVVEALRSELRVKKLELARCHEQLATLRQTEAKLRHRLSEQARRQLEKTNTKFEDLSLGDRRPTQLIRRYGNLYTEGRLDALDALDDVTEMTEFTDLKGKLLLTILVLAFRNARKSLLGVKLQVRHLLHIPEVFGSSHGARTSSFDAAASDSLALDPAVRELDDVISVYLRKTVDRFDLTRNYEEVCQRVWDTLYDFPRLRHCSGLLRYIDECVRLSWALTVQNPSFCIQYEQSRFSPDLHTRFHTSDPSSDVVRAVLWPVLTEGETGLCVHKGVVVT